MEILKISTQTLLKESDKSNKFWIHRVDLDVIKKIDESKMIGSQNRKSVVINKIRPDDRILIVTKINNSLEFIAYTQVNELSQDSKKLHDYYSSRRKLNLKGIKYLAKPMSINDFAQDFEFVVDKNNASRYFKIEYREISKSEFTYVYKKSILTKIYPPYLEKIDMTLKEFMINTIQTVFNFMKQYDKRSQIEIKSFLKILKTFLDGQGIHKNMNEIQEFYSVNAIELGFRHIPSRDLDKFVPLYLSNGEKKNFAYISLE